MKGLTFKKGVHLNYHKEITCDKNIEIMLPGKELVFPMSQHIGSPCTPIVKKGDRVLVGQKIGEANGFISTNIHSSVSGVVKEIGSRLTLRGSKEECIIIENDDQYEVTKNDIGSRADYRDLKKEELIEIVKEAGLVGLGGAAFPTHVKLSTPPDKKVEYIIINGAECEPYLTSDHRVMLENGEEVIEGIKILLEVFKEAKGIIGIENNKPDVIKHMRVLAKKVERLEVAVLETKYPQGSEKHLIYATTKREVPSGKLPIDIGCIVHNIDSMVAIYRSVVKRQPIMRRIITVSGSGVNNPCNLEVKIGTSFKEVLEYAGWDEERTKKIIVGGPMMGVAISNVHIPVIKGTSSILCFTKEEMDVAPTTNCIHCGKCVTVCPMYLLPNLLHKHALNEEYDKFTGYYGMDCIECGCCSYTCPAKRDIVQSIRTAKAVIRAKK